MPNYFAYGSNMLDARLRERVKSARPVGVGCLSGYQLRFNKRSTDGSSKCNVVATGNPLDEVMGVVFEVEEGEKVVLDGIEKGYEPTVVPIVLGGGTVVAFVYVAAPEKCDEALRPYMWYRDYVLSGARLHGLPASYIGSAIESVEAVPDPDANRAARNRHVLGRAGRP
jgi:hypothetical protein